MICGTGNIMQPLQSIIVTCSDQPYFIALQYLIESIRRFHGDRQQIICFDLGLDAEQVEWLEARLVDIHPCPELIVPSTVPGWQTWNKPLYLRLIKTNKNLIYLDADCMLLDEIYFLDNVHFIAFADTASVKSYNEEVGNSHLKNRNSLNVFQDNEYPNAGVLGITVGRHRNILDRWIENISGRLDDFFCLDQGALQLALEQTNATGFVIKDDRYNYPAIEHGIETKFCLYNYLGSLKTKGVKIAHFFDKDFYKRIGFDPEIIQSLRDRRHPVDLSIRAIWKGLELVRNE